VVVGSNLTLTVQDPPAGREEGQVLVCANAPLMLTEETVTAVLLGLVTVTVWAVLSCPVASFPNDRLDGEAVRALPGPLIRRRGRSRTPRSARRPSRCWR
jgi:hypothetical protein